MRFYSFIAAAAVLSASLAAHADTLAMSTAGTAVLASTLYTGQAFTVTGTGSYADIAFNYYTAGLTPYALGTGYLFSSVYTGTPTGLSSSDPGYLGMAAASNGFYNFGSAVTLASGQQYFFYESAAIPAGAISGNSTYAGSFFFSQSSTSGYTSTTAANFDVTGTSTISATPEPSSFALLGTGVLGMAGVLRKRFA